MSSALTGGNDVIMGEAVPPDLASLGYVQHELAAAGTATSHKVDSALTPLSPTRIGRRRGDRAKTCIQAVKDA